VICVIDESKDRLVAQGIPADKIVVVANTTHPGFAELPRDPGILARYEGRFVVSYIGAINTNRDIESLIRAAASVREEIPNLLLLLVGNSPAWHESTLRELVAQQAVGDITEFTGWQPFASLPSYIAASAICTLPLRPSEQAHASGPHKFFQYGILSKPTIVSDCQSLARLARESGAALTFEALNPQSLAEAILRLYRDPELCRRLGANGRRYALEGPYGWEQTAANLAAVYDVLSRARTLPEWRTNA
jgi:glycosyltransferase involved in cell wall biosynthesis